MKTLAPEIKGGRASLEMGRAIIGAPIDNESVHMLVPFFIGTHRLDVKGTYQIADNIFHWSNQEDLEKYFDGYDICIEGAIENR